jgi:hypothetical protein
MKTRAHLIVVFACAAFGCAGPTLVPMNPQQPIQTDYGYQQDGKNLDRSSMLTVLERQPRSAAAISTARTLQAVSLILASVGGVLAGWPIGEAAVGNPHPTWELAVAGGAALGLAIPVGFWVEERVDSAVDAHNSSFPGYPDLNDELAE